jgi:hypothetical protein
MFWDYFQFEFIYNEVSDILKHLQTSILIHLVFKDCQKHLDKGLTLDIVIIEVEFILGRFVVVKSIPKDKNKKQFNELTILEELY